MLAVTALKKIRPWLKPIMGPRIAEVRAVRERERRAAAYLQPIVQARFEAKKNDPNWQEPDDMLQWMINRSNGQHSVAEIAKMQLGLIFAAIHTTTMTATNILYTLAVTPEYIEPLREEIRTAIADNNGVITSRALQQMEKLDSYMKEVTRFYPPGTSKSFIPQSLLCKTVQALTYPTKHPSAAASSKASPSQTANACPPASSSKSPPPPSTPTPHTTRTAPPSTASATTSCAGAAARRTTRATSSSLLMKLT